MSRSQATPPRAGIVGLGYMGLATGLAFAAHGLTVTGYDAKPEIRSAVDGGRAPFHEPGLAPLLRAQRRAGRFRVVNSAEQVVRDSEGIFLCVPTPSRPSGRIELGPLRRSVREIGDALRRVPGYHVVVVKSTVVPGTTESHVAPVLLRRSGRRPDELGVASNPEFLAEGSMVRDAVSPERIVVGTTDAKALAWLRRAYRDFRAPLIALTPSGAELVKYSANAFLALKVSFANELSRLSDRLGANVDAITEAIGRDSRIGPKFLKAGPGFGGSCFAKDLKAFVVRSRELGVRLRSAEAALRINDDQLDYVLGVIRSALGPVSGKRIALLGLSFKAGTDDVRESRALPIAAQLVADGAIVRVHDPIAIENFRAAWHALSGGADGRLEFASSVEEALADADGAVLQADWPQYGRWKLEWTRRMQTPLLVDLRREISRAAARRARLTVVGIGAGQGGPSAAPAQEAGPG